LRFSEALRKLETRFRQNLMGECLDGLHCPEVETGGLGTGFATPVNVGVANAAGVATTIVRSDHVHNHPEGLGSQLHHTHYDRMRATILPPNLVATTNPTEGRVYLLPYIVPFQHTVELIGYVAGAVAGNCIVGIYADDGDTPAGGALIVESASVAIPAVANHMKELAIADTQLAAALYWLAIEFDDDSSAFRDIPAQLVDGTLVAYYYDRAGGYGALTDPCPAVTEQADGPWMYTIIASVP
jgi:hypothetical protein